MSLWWISYMNSICLTLKQLKVLSCLQFFLSLQSIVQKISPLLLWEVMFQFAPLTPPLQKFHLAQYLSFNTFCFVTLLPLEISIGLLWGHMDIFCDCTIMRLQCNVHILHFCLCKPQGKNFLLSIII